MRSLALLLVVALLAPAGLARADVAAPPRPAKTLPTAPLADVRIEGNRRVESDAVLRELKTKKGEPVDRQKVADDIRTIYKMGFFEDVEVRLLTAKEAGTAGPVVVFRVTEKPAVHAVKYQGMDNLSHDDIKDVVEVKPYTTLDMTAVENTARAIEKKYVEKGYYLARVKPDIRPVKGEDSVDVVFVVDEHAKVMVKTIRFVGNDHISGDTLRGAIETREGGWISFVTGTGTYKKDAFDRDLIRVASVYYDEGYINVKVGRPVVTLSPDKRYLFITIPVTEGEQYHVGKVDMSGDLLGKKAQLMKSLNIRSGALFRRSNLAKDIFGITDEYRDRGYAYVNVVPLTNVHPKKKTIDITLDVDKGEKVYIGRIEITGNTQTRDKVIRREMRISEGDLFSGTRIKLSKKRINALGYFSNVDIQTKPAKRKDRIDLVVDVKERATGTFQVGAGYSSGQGLLITAQISHDNLFGRGQSVSLQWQSSSLQTIFQLNFVEPYFFDTPWTFAFGAFNTRAQYNSFISHTTGGNVTWGYRLVDNLHLFLTYTLEDVSEEFNRIIPAGFATGGRTSSVKATITYDTRDNRLFPTRGTYQTFSAEYAAPWLGSQNDYTRLSLTSRFYYPLVLGIVARLQIQLGEITGPKFPLSERYYLGGVYDLRGYVLRSISPTVQFPTSGDPGAATSAFQIGGNKQAVANFEFEFPLLPPIGLRGVVFYDVGNAWSDNEQWFQDRQTNLPLGMYHDVGFGVRWFSPIGPLRFEWGIPLTRRPQDETIHFEFTVGNFF